MQPRTAYPAPWPSLLPHVPFLNLLMLFQLKSWKKHLLHICIFTWLCLPGSPQMLALPLPAALRQGPFSLLHHSLSFLQARPICKPT